MRRLAASVVALVACAALAVPAAATFSGRNGLVAYGDGLSNGSGLDGIWTMHADGSTRRRVVLMKAARSPAFSPDGRMIAFAGSHTSGERTGIFVMRPSGRGLRKVASRGSSPRWSPSGHRIEFVRGDPGRHELWDVSVHGGAGRKLADLGAAVAPIPAPTGHATATIGTDGVLLVRTGDEAPRVLYREDGGVVREASWSPDGRWLLFSSVRLAGCNAPSGCYEALTLGKIHPDGSGLRFLELDVPTAHAARSAQFSPNGLAISYCRPHVVSYGFRLERWTMRPDGTHRRFVTIAGCDGDWQARPRLRKALPRR